MIAVRIAALCGAVAVGAMFGVLAVIRRNERRVSSTLAYLCGLVWAAAVVIGAWHARDAYNIVMVLDLMGAVLALGGIAMIPGEVARGYWRTDEAAVASHERRVHPPGPGVARGADGQGGQPVD